MAEEGAQGEVQQEAQATQEATSQATPPEQTGAAQPTQGASTPSTPSWLESFRSEGIDLGTDETQAKARISQLYQTQKQFEELQSHFQRTTPLMREYASNRDKYLAWAKQQQEAQEAAKPKPYYHEHWNPPEFDQNWLALRDQDGKLPLEIQAKVDNYMNYRRAFAEKFMSNPFQTLEDPMRRLVREEAQKIVQEQLGQRDQSQTVQGFLKENEAWLYERDQAGKTQFAFNPASGQYDLPKLSKWGEMFSKAIQSEHERQQQRGYQDIGEQIERARLVVENAYLVAERQQPPTTGANGANGAENGPAKTPRQQANAKFMKEANGSPVLSKKGAVPADRKIQSATDFAAVLREQMAAEGIKVE